MPKILVADDNTNIQRMVALALQERGIDVISVGNGEAAVRRLPDLMPDMVLADIFMPVRNGYEVCEYMKKDARFAEIPVVLLIGAFDPLDEKEARRVGADGILKKPFVPPDPLIAMVMSVLEKNPRVVAEMAKAKEAKLAPPAPQPASVEFSSSPISEPKPLPHYPEPGPAEAARAYGFGSGRRGVDGAGKVAEPVAPIPDPSQAAEEDLDNTSTGADWRRSAMDFEISEADVNKPAFAADEMSDASSVNSPAEKRISAPSVSDEGEFIVAAVSQDNFAEPETQPFSLPSESSVAVATHEASSFSVLEPAVSDPQAREEEPQHAEIASTVPVEVAAEFAIAPQIDEAEESSEWAEPLPSIAAEESKAKGSPPNGDQPGSATLPAQPHVVSSAAQETFATEIQTRQSRPQPSPAGDTVSIEASASSTDNQAVPAPAASSEPAPAAASEHSFASRVRGWMESIAPSGNPEGGWLASVANVLSGGEKAKQSDAHPADSAKSGATLEHDSVAGAESSGAVGASRRMPATITSFETVLDEPFFLDDPLESAPSSIASHSASKHVAATSDQNDPAKPALIQELTQAEISAGETRSDAALAEAHRSAGFEQSPQSTERTEDPNSGESFEAHAPLVEGQRVPEPVEAIQAAGRLNDAGVIDTQFEPAPSPSAEPISATDVSGREVDSTSGALSTAPYKEPDLIEPPAVVVTPEPLLIDEDAPSRERSEYGARPQEVPPLYSFIVPEAASDSAPEPLSAAPVEEFQAPASTASSIASADDVPVAHQSSTEPPAQVPLEGTERTAPENASHRSMEVIEAASQGAFLAARQDWLENEKPGAPEIAVQHSSQASGDAAPEIASETTRDNAFEDSPQPAAERPRHEGPRPWHIGSDLIADLISEGPLPHQPASEQPGEFFAAETDSAQSSAEEESGWTPTMAPPNREALQSIPFLTPPREFLADLNSQKTWGAIKDVRSEDVRSEDVQSEPFRNETAQSETARGGDARTGQISQEFHPAAENSQQPASRSSFEPGADSSAAPPLTHGTDAGQSLAHNNGESRDAESQPHAPSNASVKAVAKEMMVDEVVRKVLERLEPRLHELLTEGLLKPLVDSILHEESENK